MDLNDRLMQNPEMPSRDIDGFVHVIDPVKGTLHTFNDVGKRAWDAFAKARAVRDVVDVLADEYDVSRAQLEADVLQFVEALMDLQLLVTIEPGTPSRDRQ